MLCTRCYTRDDVLLMLKWSRSKNQRHQDEHTHKTYEIFKVLAERYSEDMKLRKTQLQDCVENMLLRITIPSE